jgi:hypothetical protein
VTRALGIGRRLSEKEREKPYLELADRVEEARRSYAFDDDKRTETIAPLEAAVAEGDSRATLQAPRASLSLSGRSAQTTRERCRAQAECVRTVGRA